MGMAAEQTQVPGSVVVIGGGVAGLACAVRLVEAGVRVTVLEATERLGGRAGSTAGGHDLGQHVILRCCTNAVDFYTRLGVIDRFAWHDRLYFARAGQAEVDVLRASSWLPAPLHFASGFARASFLSLRDKSELVRGVAAMMGAADQQEQDGTFGSWLQNHGQGESVIERFWNPVVVGACNVPVDGCSTRVAVQVFHRGMLASRGGMVLGIPTSGLGELLEGGAHAYGEDVRPGVGVRRVMVEEVEAKVDSRVRGNDEGVGNDGRGSGTPVSVSGVSAAGRATHHVEGVALVNGEVLQADGYVLAVPGHRVCGLFADRVLEHDARLQAAGRMTYSPILGVDLWFGRPVMDLPYLTVVGSPLHWLFRKDGGRRVHAVVSACDDWMGLTRDEVADRVLGCLADVQQVSVDGSSVLGVRVTRVKRATIAPVPGIEADGRRPGAGGGHVSNLFVAGDWCDTGGWPSTIEGAVRSGYRAAAAVLGVPAEAIEVPEMGHSGVYRWLCSVFGSGV
ncbi:MAG: FAD-dependent oxidoreductase [Planctomycetes bacterium]|nr:FAD-dependent oxidoreductase [Planctomycetota bacterium]NOG55386.1 NAD(P)-binding protein [Planctomycetota bacterium]